jgi:hypothetical protein
VKAIIYDRLQIPVEQQRLIWGAREIFGSTTLQEYGVSAEAMFHLVLRLCGGMLTHSSGRVDHTTVVVVDAPEEDAVTDCAIDMPNATGKRSLEPTDEDASDTSDDDQSIKRARTTCIVIDELLEEPTAVYIE